MIVRAAAVADIEPIRHVARESWFATYRGIFDDAYIEAFLARAYSVEGLERSIRAANDIFLVAEREGIIAFSQFGDRGAGQELLRIYALPTSFSTGVGQAMLDDAERVLVERGTTSYFAMVHEKNERGRRFYQRAGFERDAAGDDDDHLKYVRTLRV